MRRWFVVSFAAIKTKALLAPWRMASSIRTTFDVGSVLRPDQVELAMVQLHALAEAARLVAPAQPQREGNDTLSLAAWRAFREVAAALERSKWPVVRDAIAAADSGPLAVALAIAVTLDKEVSSKQPQCRAAVSAIARLCENDDDVARTAAEGLLRAGFEVLGPLKLDARSAAVLCRSASVRNVDTVVRGVVDMALDDSQLRSDLAAAASLVAATASSIPRAVDLVTQCAQNDLWDSAEDVVDDRATATALVEGALLARRPRQADLYARKYVHYLVQDGETSDLMSRAAFQHAMSTLDKVTARKHHALVEKVARGVDNCPGVDDARKRAVKAYALECLRRQGEYVVAGKLCTDWGLEWNDYDEDRAREDAIRRREMYFQWSETPFSKESPRLVGSADELVAAVTSFIAATPQGSVVGIDVEWDDLATQGVSVLQLASTSSLLLVDAAMIISDGRAASACAALSRIFTRCTLVGFAPKQDRNRLFRAGLVPEHLDIIDLQPLAHGAAPPGTFFVPSKKSHPGLAVVSEVFLGKALDKSEQCSVWSARPLSHAQLVYAALDAYILVLLSDHILSSTTTTLLRAAAPAARTSSLLVDQGTSSPAVASHWQRF